LEAGDTAYVPGAIGLTVCTDATLGAAQWQGAAQAATMRRSYGTGSLAFAGKPAPLTTVAARGNAERGGGNWQAIEQFDLYYNMCVMHLRVYDTNDVLIAETEQRFASLADVVAWVNANTPSAGGGFTANCQFEIHDEIDGTVDMPAKVYGKNRLWAGLTAKTFGKYYHSPPAWSCFDANGSNRRLHLANVLNNIWNYLYPTSPMPAPAAWTANEFGVFWLSRNRLRKYDMPGFVNSLAMPAPKPRRYARDIVTSTTALATVFMFNDAAAANLVGYSALLPNGTADTLPTAFGTFEAFSLLSKKIMGGYSVVLGYPLTDGANKRSVLIKPIGMDQFYLDSFDPTKYRVEAVGVQRRDFHPRIAVLSGLSQAHNERSTSVITGGNFAEVFGYTNSQAQGGIPGRHGYRTGTVKFQYRDLATGHVGPVSTAAIKTVWRQRARPFALMVRNNVGV